MVTAEEAPRGDLTLGYSPCPNDTFIFYALVHRRISGAPKMRELLEDIETLNDMASRGQLDAVKVSFHALGHLRDRYCLLRAGGALGRGCGPLIVAREKLDCAQLAKGKVAIPGKMTTAALLLRLYCDTIESVVMPFDEIMSSVQQGRVDAGVIIHESRFIYPEYGLHQVVDLGQWWEQTTGHPIPLGGIVARRDLGAELIGRLDAGLGASVDFAHEHPDEVREYVAAHAQEMDPEVIEATIQLYVNDYTRDYGVAGGQAIADLMIRASAAGIVPASDTPLFLTEATR